MRFLVPLVLLLPACAQEERPAWPPKVGEKFPDLKLVDQTGERVSMSSLKGKTIIVEAVGMP